MGDAEQLKKLREPFLPQQIGKLPKGGVQLDFVGHGWITQRLLDVDPTWNWRPMAFDERGLPQFDEHGGLWMYLLVGGVERPGYGGPSNPAVNAIKEAIGDGLRNSGMRFGVALDLWCRGNPDAPVVKPRTPADKARDELLDVCKREGIAPSGIAASFTEDTGLSIYEADANTILAFAKTLGGPSD